MLHFRLIKQNVGYIFHAYPETCKLTFLRFTFHDPQILQLVVFKVTPLIGRGQGILNVCLNYCQKRCLTNSLKD